MRGGDAGETGATGIRGPVSAACQYWNRRGLETQPSQVVLAPSGPILLLAVFAAVGPGGVLVPRPCAQWHTSGARLLGRRLLGVQVPAECGGVPDPFALQETVRRERAEGGDPRVLLLSVADNLTGTAAPPELLYDVCEVAAAEGLLIVSDESWRDTSHHQHDTVIVSPGEISEQVGRGSPGGEAVVLLDLPAGLLVAGPSAACARFPTSSYGQTLREATAGVLRTLGAALSEVACQAATVALSEPEALRAERRADVLRHGRYAAALHDVVRQAGAHARPPRLGRGLYADLGPLREPLAARGVTDTVTLEADLVLAVGPWARGGHWFGDHPSQLRVWLGTGMLAMPGPPRMSDPSSEVGTEQEPQVGSAALGVDASRTLNRLSRALPGVPGDLEGMR